MKKIFLVLCFVFLLFSCWEENKEEKGIIEDTSDSIDWYVDTLEWSIHDARGVVDISNDRNKKMEEEINSAR